MNDRITIRLDDKDIDLIDAFVASNPEFTDRSKFLRAAAIEYIKMSGQSRLGQKDEVKLSLGPRTMDKILLLLSTERYDTPHQAATELFKIGLETVKIEELLKKEGFLEPTALAAKKYREVEDLGRKFNTK